MLDDVVYYATLAASVTLGSHYKRIENFDMKLNYGVGVGILTACLICGRHIYHTILMVWGNIVIIKCCEKRYIHIMSLIWTWVCLLYLHINLSHAVYVIWLHQYMALRLVGMAFEIHSNDKTNPREMSKTRLSLGDANNALAEPSSADIISYAFFFIGIHRGPYYKWKIFKEHIQGSFGLLGDCRIITEQKMKKIFICGVGYLILRMNYSSQIYYEESFYRDYDMDSRYLYNVIFLLMYFLKCQLIMLLCTSVFTEAGFGVYPAKCQPLPGHGPSTRLSLLKMAHSLEEALAHEFNFAMLKCFDNEKIIIGPRMSDTLKSWNMPTRYWFWANTYNNLIDANKELRGMTSFLAWCLWCGPSLQQIIISSTLWVYIHIEAEYSELYDTRGSMKVPWDIGFSIMRMFCLIYLTPCLVVDDAAVILKYYNSIFWIYHIILIVLIVGAIVIYKSRDDY